MAATLIGAAPAAATDPELLRVAVRASCVSGPGYRLTIGHPMPGYTVRAPGGVTVPVPAGRGPAEVHVPGHFDSGVFEVVAGNGTVVVTKPIPRGHACDGWPSIERYLLEDDDAPTSPQGLNGVTATSPVVSRSGLRVFRAADGAFYQERGDTSPGHVVRGAIYDYYRARGEFDGPLRHPLTSEFEVSTLDGFYTRFQGGTVYWSPVGGARTVKGAIATGYSAGDYERGVGLPVTEEFGPLVRRGFGQHFTGGSVYWSPASGAWPVQAGPIRDRWAALGWERSFAGYPTAGPVSFSRGFVGRIQRFQGATFVSMPGHAEVTTVRGAIRDAWLREGEALGEVGAVNVLGMATTPEEFGPLRGGGFGQHFSAGSVYFSPATGAHAVPDGGNSRFRTRWAALGWENGIGYPTSDVPLQPGPSGWFVQHFQRGTLYSDAMAESPAPVLLVKGAIRDAYASAGWHTGRYGYPTTEEYPVPGGVRQDFQHGSMTYTWTTGKVT